MSLTRRIKVPSDNMEEEVDLDIRPFMNVLLILIPFLASVAVYTRLSVLDLSLPPNVGAASSPAAGEKPKLKLTVVLKTDRLDLTFGEKLLETLPKTGDDYDYAGLKEKLLARGAELGLKDEVIVAVKDQVTFGYVVKVMDVCRESGFAKMGVAGATEDPGTGK